jgi:hypothetical protein
MKMKAKNVDKTTEARNDSTNDQIQGSDDKNTQNPNTNVSIR